MLNKDIRSTAVTSGVASLSDAELVEAVSGDSHDGFLANIGGVSELSHSDISVLRRHLGLADAVRLASAVELGRRVMNSDIAKVECVTSSDDIVKLFPQLPGSQHEEFWAVFLNSAGRVLDRVRISQGGVSVTTVDTRLIVKRAIELLAVSLVLVHNHPSGVAEPSDDDREVTERVRQAAELFDIRLVDHIILVSGGSFSFFGAGLI